MGSAPAALLVAIPLIIGIGLGAGVEPGRALTAVARSEIPAELLPIYQHAAKRCERLPWQVLAAVGWVESKHGGGRVDFATGELDPPLVGPAQDGRAGSAAVEDPAQADGWARPLGPMQILPGAWRDWATLAPGRPAGATPSIHNAWDSIHSTAAEFCAGAPAVDNLVVAILDHHPRRGYFVEVMTKAGEYGLDARITVEMAREPLLLRGPSADAVVAAAAAMVGRPYVWGAESPAEGFDCSGLVWWAYRELGITLPRTTSGQIFSGTEVAPGEPLRPGDLLFTRGGAPVRDRGHVSIYAGEGKVVVAPRTGEAVAIKPLDLSKIQAVRRILAPR